MVNFQPSAGLRNFSVGAHKQVPFLSQTFVIGLRMGDLGEVLPVSLNLRISELP